MTSMTNPTWIAFAGHRRIGAGVPREVAKSVKAHLEAYPDAQVLVFDAVSSRPVEIDLRGSLTAVLKRLPQAPLAAATSADSSAGGPMRPARQPGRPRLGVVAREVTLLPRHWDWLASQPGGASVALRKLVEEASRGSRAADRKREAEESAYRFMSAMAGNEPGFEEATRALFAGDRARFDARIAGWPADLRAHCAALAAVAFESGEGADVAV